MEQFPLSDLRGGNFGNCLWNFGDRELGNLGTSGNFWELGNFGDGEIWYEVDY
jgi:hypothetical protein